MANQTRDYGELRVTLTSQYDWIYSDIKSGARRNAAFFNPKPQGNLCALGSIGVTHYNEINGKQASILVGPNPNQSPPSGKGPHLQGQLAIRKFGMTQRVVDDMMVLSGDLMPRLATFHLVMLLVVVTVCHLAHQQYGVCESI